MSTDAFETWFASEMVKYRDDGDMIRALLNAQNTARMQNFAHYERAKFCNTPAKKACTNCTASQVVRVADGKVSAC